MDAWLRTGILIGTSLLTGEPLGSHLCTALFAGVFNTDDDPSDIYRTIDREDHANRVDWVKNASREDWDLAGLDLCPVDFETGKDARAPSVAYENREAYTNSFSRYAVSGKWKKILNAMREGVVKIIGGIRFGITCNRFSAHELREIVCGKDGEPSAEIMARDAYYMGGLNGDSMTVKWLWRWVRGAPGRSRFLLEFCTGSRSIPSCGLRNLSGYGGSTTPFSICRADGGAGRLPYASTCLNRLMLPPYPSYDSLARAMNMTMQCDIAYDESAVSNSMPAPEFA
jgi:hypothetical protein